MLYYIWGMICLLNWNVIYTRSTVNFTLYVKPRNKNDPARNTCLYLLSTLDHVGLFRYIQVGVTLPAANDLEIQFEGQVLWQSLRRWCQHSTWAWLCVWLQHSHTGTALCPGYSTSDSTPTLMAWEEQQMAQVLVLLHSCGRSQMKLLVPDLALF